MTKFSVLGVLLTSLFLASSPVKGQASTTATYGDSGSVGFTGKYPTKPPTSPSEPDVKLPPEEVTQITPSPSTPITVPNGGGQSITLPSTGDTSNKVYFVTASLLLAFIALLTEKILKGKKAINQKNYL